MVEARLSSGSVWGLVPSKQSAEIPGTDNTVFAYPPTYFFLVLKRKAEKGDLLNVVSLVGKRNKEIQ